MIREVAQLRLRVANRALQRSEADPLTWGAPLQRGQGKGINVILAWHGALGDQLVGGLPRSG